MDRLKSTLALRTNGFFCTPPRGMAAPFRYSARPCRHSPRQPEAHLPFARRAELSFAGRKETFSSLAPITYGR
ncbi:hypothetical protein chiPu_0004324 [Chiloscyllium punctatum]|uniref:Uncharacterized protein n=1 Tax=Chiloscyllium punctatum TaxID=137246 RepID=A0A401S697_CHIPU|nr:hypothetical protein [Chiloscyllium punctatum]